MRNGSIHLCFIFNYLKREQHQVILRIRGFLEDFIIKWLYAQ